MQPAFFLAGNRARNSVGFCDRSAQFLVNCFEKIVMATNNSGLNLNHLLVSEERREREEEKGIE